MKRAVLLVFAAAAGCTTAAPPPAGPSMAASTDRPQENREWTDRQIQQDVESSVRERFGETVFRQAMEADASIMSKLYRGMPLPPVQQPDGKWKEAAHPVALMFRQNARWFRAGPQGVSVADAASQTEIETLLRSQAFWAEPARIAQGGCTDGGSTLFVIRLPGQGARVRQGTCGGPALHSRLISAVY